MRSRHYWIAIALIVVATVARVASTHLTFAQTLDEPVHVAAGHEWLTKGYYHIDFQHPPMPRALFALPFLKVIPQNPTHPSEYGNDLYAQDDRYIHNVAAARRATLLFVIVAALALAATARQLFGNAVACAALVAFVSLPPVLAHSGLATTDMPVAAGFALALYALLRWVEEPVSWSRTLLLGAAIAWGVCCKYSFVVFFPVAMLIVMIARRRFAPRQLIIAVLFAGILIWGAFGFSFRTLAESSPNALDIVRGAGISERWAHIRVPAADFVLGLVMVRFHNHIGHSAFLLGQVSDSGWWYYFPVALGVKTPIPYLLLAAIGAWLLIRRRRVEAALVVIALAILLIAMASRINIGIRHILPMYVPLSIIAGYAVVELWKMNRLARCATTAAITWLLLSSMLAHPDYLPWMNAFAGKRPQHVLLDSNYDWGQDIWRLARICRERGITSLEFAVVTDIRPSSIGITGGHPLQEDSPAHGWIVISEQSLELARAKHPNAYKWLDQYSNFERIGKTLRLYHLE